MELLTLVLTFALGLLVGVLSKGVKITIKHEKELPTYEYNESLVEELPLDVQQYYQQNQGRNEW
jgi:hypothetical protein